MKYIIIDNEVQAQQNISNLIQQLQPKWKAEALFNDIDSTLHWMEGNRQPDLIFLNVQLFGNKNLNRLNHSCTESSIIFTTANAELTHNVFDLNQIDYLQKPVRQNTLKPLLHKYANLNGNRLSLRKDIAEVARLIEQNSRTYIEKFTYESLGKLKEIPVKEIAYFYSMNKITFAVTKSKREYILDTSLEKIEKEINPKDFFRTNRQTICGRDSIADCEPWFNGKFMVSTEPDYAEKIIISREKSRAFKSWWNKK